jgi:predicted SPOUT superfamily RNA methylase MTH1
MLRRCMGMERGVAGLEVAVRNDMELQKLGVTEAEEVFDHWINVCPGQGSRTIRTEEAIWMGLMGLRRFVVNNGNDNE